MLTIILLPLLISSWSADSAAALPTDAVGLLAFKASADLNNVLLYNINEPFDHCEWRGVKCAQGRVVRYDVQGFGLRGGVAAATLSRLDQLRVLNLKNNSLAGPVPDFSALVNLKTLLLGRNYFSGEFPPSLLFLRNLQVLDFSRNNFTGFLPENLTGLSLLESVRLEYNRFSGFIPPLNQTNLRVFNVSHNNLSGQIPLTPTLKKLSVFSFLHNPNLCGEVINVPCRHSDFFNSSSAAAAPLPSPPSPHLQITQSSDTPSPDRRKHRVKVGLILGLFTGVLVLFAVFVSVFALFRKRGREEESEETQQIQDKADERNPDVKASSETTTFFSIQPENPISGVKKNVGNRFAGGNLIFFSLEEEQYTLEQLMKASAELLGRGSIGTTYKAVMANQLAVSLKRLDSSKTAIISEEAFEQHMESIGVLRHPNLVPIRAYFRAKHERLIIYDYQPNGSLFNLIHGSRSTRGKPLHWTSCLKIAEDVAKGLAYIHQASRFIHGNLKSSNVLLGSDFEACLTDYCLTPIVDTSLDNDQDSSNYKAPETRKSAHFSTPKSDVYAFGILLLELLSGKHPSQHPFLAPLDMSDWVRAMRDNEGEDDMRLRMLVEVASFCSIASPEQRPTMWQVLKMINNMKEIVGVGSSDP